MCWGLLALFYLAQNAAGAIGIDLFNKSIPAGDLESTTGSYHELPIDFSDPLSKEPLVDLKDYGVHGEAFYARQDGLNAPYHTCICPGDSQLKSRKTVAFKLRQINKRLAVYGLELFVLDAYRPASCQRSLWKFFLTEAERILGAKTSEAEIIKYAEKYCSNPTTFDPKNFTTCPTHLTGGAVDLTIRRKATGELLYMGGIFDDASDQTITDYFEKLPKKNNNEVLSASDLEARRNRRLLYWIMTEEGFANYPNEWWHFDYGNQMWVQNRQRKTDRGAFFGGI